MVLLATLALQAVIHRAAVAAILAEAAVRAAVVQVVVGNNRGKR